MQAPGCVESHVNQCKNIPRAFMSIVPFWVRRGVSVIGATPHPLSSKLPQPSTVLPPDKGAEHEPYPDQNKTSERPPSQDLKKECEPGR
jgi:hypothetical protein